jgi:exonuclease III
MKKIFAVLTITLCILCNATVFAQETFKTMFYNVLNYPDQDASKLQYLELILDDYKPDIFMVCELNNEEGADYILSSLQQINPNYESAIYQNNSSDDNNGDFNELQNFMYFDSSKFILESQETVATSIRDFNRYTLKLNTTDQENNPVFVEVFVCHLKASSGESNEQLRLNMVTALQDYLDNSANEFTADSNVILAGDFNVYRSTEPAFSSLIDSNNTITFIDPANSIGFWHNNTNYIDVFTQSTRTQSGLGGASGGFDDRFDFILTSSNLDDNSDFEFVPDSYKVYGNNGVVSCYNQAINSNNCAGTDYSNFIRDALYNMSDHLPVTLSFQTSQTLLSNADFTSISPLELVSGNMVAEQLVFRINSSEAAIKTVTIYNVLGQTIATQKVSKNASIFTMDVSSFANGMFYVGTSNKLIKPITFIKVD